ncbi:MAG: hypothetical protein EA426_01005 [Spirochaetaceae bacterium]|nr:MAG: hypothetical protein EA426_01005 [Spirochaetaceae bacterium]
MKRMLLIVVVSICLFVPAQVFGGVGIGVAAFSDTPVLSSEDVNRELLEGTFSFGANGRIRFNSLNLDALGLYMQAEESIDLYLTAQLSLQFLLFRVSGGIGPALRFPFGDGRDPIDDLSIDWLNAKIDFDVLLGRISAGLSFQYLVPSSAAQAIDFRRARGRIGAAVIIW